MSLKLRDFAKTDVESERIATKEEGEFNSDEDIQYDAPRSREDDTIALPPGYESVPRNFKDEKPFFGPRIDGNVQVQYPSIIDGYQMDNKALSQMEGMGLPTGFSFRNMTQEKQKKGDKKTFYCQICLIELNSQDTMISHCKGVKHMKKQQTVDAEKEKQYRRGEISVEEFESTTRNSVIPIPNPESTKKKVPVRLHEKIKETRDPVVGLDFIREWIAVSDAEMEPHYECQLCGNQGIANGMFSHLMGHKHRQKFVDELYKDSPDRVVDLSQSDLLKIAGKYNENNENLSEKIKTRRSDEEYPWPPGKAPWAVERGGTGIPPDGARENWGKNKHHEKEAKPVVVGRVFGNNGASSPIEKSSGLPSLSSLKPPKDETEAEKFIVLGERLLCLGLEFSGARVSSKEEAVLKACLTSIVSKMKSRLGVRQVNGRHSPTRPERSPGSPASSGKRPPPVSHRAGHEVKNSRSPSPYPAAKRRRTPPETLHDSRIGSVKARMTEDREYRRSDGAMGEEYRERDYRGSDGTPPETQHGSRSGSVKSRTREKEWTEDREYRRSDGARGKEHKEREYRDNDGGRDREYREHSLYEAGSPSRGGSGGNKGGWDRSHRGGDSREEAYYEGRRDSSKGRWRDGY